MRTVRRVELTQQGRFVASLVIDLDGDLQVDIGPVDAMRRTASDLASEHHLVEVRPDVWQRGPFDGELADGGARLADA
jgi:hypothetical protein